MRDGGRLPPCPGQPGHPGGARASHRHLVKSSGVMTARFHREAWNPVMEYSGTTLAKGHRGAMGISGTMQGAGGVGGLLSGSLINQ